MTPDELRAARKALGLTGKALARELRMGKHAWQTISDWECGRRPIPGPASKAIELMLDRSSADGATKPAYKPYDQQLREASKRRRERNGFLKD